MLSIIWESLGQEARDSVTYHGAACVILLLILGYSVAVVTKYPYFTFALVWSFIMIGFQIDAIRICIHDNAGYGIHETSVLITFIISFLSSTIGTIALNKISSRAEFALYVVSWIFTVVPIAVCYSYFAYMLIVHINDQYNDMITAVMQRCE